MVPTDGVAKSGFNMVLFNMIFLLCINLFLAITSFSLPSNNSGCTLYFGISGSSLVAPCRFGNTVSSLIWYAFVYSVWIFFIIWLFSFFICRWYGVRVGVDEKLRFTVLGCFKVLLLFRTIMLNLLSFLRSFKIGFTFWPMIWISEWMFKSSFGICWFLVLNLFSASFNSPFYFGWKAGYKSRFYSLAFFKLWLYYGLLSSISFVLKLVWNSALFMKLVVSSNFVKFYVMVLLVMHSVPGIIYGPITCSSGFLMGSTNL